MDTQRIIERNDIYEYFKIISDVIGIKSFEEFMDMGINERNNFKKDIKKRIREEKINKLIKE